MIVLVCIVISAVAITYINNKNSVKTPIDNLINAINNNDISEIPKSFHEYCSLAIEQDLSKRAFETYIESVSLDVGGNFKMSYEITNKNALSKDAIERHESYAKFEYSNYPYLLNGGNLEFENVYEVLVNIEVKGPDQEKHMNVDFLIVEINGKYYLLPEPNSIMSMFII